MNLKESYSEFLGFKMRVIKRGKKKNGQPKYVVTPKYRRKVIYNSIKTDIREIIRNLCEWKGVEILEGHLMPDHIHMLVAIPPKYSVSQFMGYLKGKSAMMI